MADAIRDHYAPKGPDDRCPTRAGSVVVALADKLDTLAGFFAAGDQADRLAGTRSRCAAPALGVIRLILENRLRLPLRHAFAAALAGYGERFRCREVEPRSCSRSSPTG